MNDGERMGETYLRPRPRPSVLEIAIAAATPCRLCASSACPFPTLDPDAATARQLRYCAGFRVTPGFDTLSAPPIRLNAYPGQRRAGRDSNAGASSSPQRKPQIDTRDARETSRQAVLRDATQSALCWSLWAQTSSGSWRTMYTVTRRLSQRRTSTRSLVRVGCLTRPDVTGRVTFASPKLTPLICTHAHLDRAICASPRINLRSMHVARRVHAPAIVEGKGAEAQDCSSWTILPSAHAQACRTEVGIELEHAGR